MEKFYKYPPPHVRMNVKEWIEYASQTIIKRHHKEDMLLIEGTTYIGMKYKFISQVYYLKPIGDEFLPTPLLDESITITLGEEMFYGLKDGVSLSVNMSRFGKFITAETDYDGIVYIVLSKE